MKLENVYLNRTASFLPNEAISNDEMESYLGMIDNRESKVKKLVLRINGILTRYYAIDKNSGQRTHSNAQMTAEAVRRLSGEGLSLDDIECLACGTSSPDQLLPSHAVMVHGEIKSPHCEVISTSGVCSSGMQAFKYGFLSVLSGQTRNAVCTGSELSSACMRGTQFEDEIQNRKLESIKKKPVLSFEKEFLRWMLSDGAGAFFLENKPNPEGLSLKVEWIDLYSFAHELPVCMYMGANKNEDGSLTGFRDYSVEELGNDSILSLKQDVRLLNEHMVNIGIRSLKMSSEKHGFEFKEIDYFLPHVSSHLFADELEKGFIESDVQLPRTNWFLNLATVGNIGSASIYLMLDELYHSGKIEPGNKILLAVPESGRFSMGFALMTAQ